MRNEEDSSTTESLQPCKSSGTDALLPFESDARGFPCHGDKPN